MVGLSKNTVRKSGQASRKSGTVIAVLLAVVVIVSTAGVLHYNSSVERITGDTQSGVAAASSLLTSETKCVTDESFPLLNLPAKTKSVVLAIGTNLDPILPRQRDGPCARTIAFEPIVHERIPPHPQVMVVPAAVSNQTSLSTMYLQRQRGVQFAQRSS